MQQHGITRFRVENHGKADFPYHLENFHFSAQNFIFEHRNAIF